MVKWNNEEIEILREMHPFGGAKKVSEITGISINGIHRIEWIENMINSIILVNSLLIEDMGGGGLGYDKMEIMV